eukprot:9485925-Pyramimonas_sp.AAC.1
MRSSSSSCPCSPCECLRCPPCENLIAAFQRGPLARHPNATSQRGVVVCTLNAERYLVASERAMTSYRRTWPHAQHCPASTPAPMRESVPVPVRIPQRPQTRADGTSQTAMEYHRTLRAPALTWFYRVRTVLVLIFIARYIAV